MRHNLPLGPEQLSGSSRVRSAARSRDSQTQEARLASCAHCEGGTLSSAAAPPQHASLVHVVERPRLGQQPQAVAHVLEEHHELLDAPRLDMDPEGCSLHAYGCSPDTWGCSPDGIGLQPRRHRVTGRRLALP